MAPAEVLELRTIDRPQIASSRCSSRCTRPGSTEAWPTSSPAPPT